jgi:FKBP-type peptidyl-prolyl cis-trans isomerase FklB
MVQFQQQVMAQQQQKAATEGDRNKADGAAFLAKNKQIQGVQTLPSGVQYKVLKQGAGATPKAADTVTTHYRGSLIDGTVFDSSYDRGEPASFGVTQVIKGWTEVLQLMKVGDKWQVFIPSDLAYGPQGRPPKIAPNAVLIFEMELLDVKPGQ